MLIKHFYYFGVCDGHGVNGHHASNHAKHYIPSNLIYFEILNILIEMGKYYDDFAINLNKNECNENLIKLLYEKLNLSVYNFSFPKKVTKTIHRVIKDSFEKTHQDLKNRSFEAEFSGTTVCSVFIYGSNIYCANLGDSRAVLGSLEGVILY
jgi:serine/threonine protein phosphatase PrpC